LAGRVCFLNASLTLSARKKWRGFGNFVPEFFIDAETRDGKISGLVHNFI
jgi:hypothetical protein